MTDRLLRSFRFRVSLRRSAPGEAGREAAVGGELAAGAGFSAGTSLNASAGFSPGAGGALSDGAFQECTGLEVEMDVQEYLEGGRNDGVVRRVGRAKYVPLVLKRGMFYPQDGTVDRELWRWLQGVVAGERPVPRYDGMIQVMGDRDDIVATWVFDRGLPSRVRGPELNGKTGEIAMEELHILHEGLRLEEG